jgi:Tfp pilus assembly pilus retraction ATPase PilT
MSNLNIVEHRLPQDGRAIVKIQDQTLDLRISFIPTPYGESAVIRILPMELLFDLEKLGLLASDLKIFEELIKKPHGIIFVTGPTGSGKTTTLYACLSKINTDERKIITIEDPLEYEMEGITQIQVMPEIGLDFARGLRSMLRHDPDVMMVGEVRDLETAEIAIRVALTGHLVFSTLHTNDAASGITRLIDIGVEPYLVASSVEAFIAQRLVRLICPDCKEENTMGMSELRNQIAQDLQLKSREEVKIYRGRGCEKCNFTGFYGRTAIYEILLIEEAIKDLILHKAAAEQIKKVAIAHRMCTLRQNGWKKVIAGLTTPDEVMKVTHAEKYEFSPLPSLVKSGQNVAGDLVEFRRSNVVIPEKRRMFVRLDADIKIHYKIVKPETGLTKRGYEVKHVCNTENISAGGLLFISHEALALGSILELDIELPDGDTSLKCLCRVVRVEELDVERAYEIAVYFLDISGAERVRLNKYVQERL